MSRDIEVDDGVEFQFTSRFTGVRERERGRINIVGVFWVIEQEIVRIRLLLETAGQFLEIARGILSGD